MKVGGSKVIKAYFNGNLVFGGKLQDVYVTFTGNQKITVSMPKKYWKGTIEYSLDGYTWNTWSCSAVTSTTDANKIFFRGKGNTYVTGSDAQSFGNGFIVNGTDSSTFEFTVTGDLQNLLDYEVLGAGGTPSAAADCFSYLFYKQNIVGCDPLAMESVPKDGYFYMFAQCSKLVTPPQILAKTVGDSAFCRMFWGSAVTETPEFVFTSIGSYGCNSMFYECTSLKKIHFPSETVTASTYSFDQMFSGCSALEDAGVDIHIKGTTDDNTSNLNYAFMQTFFACKMLKSAPNFYIHSGNPYAMFHSTFMNCSVLETAGNVTMSIAGTGAGYMFYQTFSQCTKLTTPPTMTGVGFGYSSQCYNMFYYCSALNKIYSFRTLGGTKTNVEANSFTGMYYKTQCEVGPAASYGNAYQIVVATVTTASSIYNFTYNGTTPISNVNTGYGTNSEIIMVN